jgi:ubiquinone/menaquinone biosynthesis C-methylase UbiE
LSPARSKVEIGERGARYYDVLLSLLSIGRYSQFMKEVIEKMDIKPGQSILDLGSGTGKNDCFMSEKVGSQGKIVGLDISDEMISRALKRCHEYPNMSFEQQRIELPLAYKEEFDKVFISFVLHGFEDDQKVEIIRNAYQALKPGETFHVLDYAEFDIDRMWFPLRWAFARFECQLAVEFLKLDIKGILRAQGFTSFKEEFFLRRHLRLLSAVKPLDSTLEQG